MIEKEIQLQSYNIYLGPLGDNLPVWLQDKSFSTVLFLIDKNVFEAWENEILKLQADIGADRHVFEAGEQNKNLATCRVLWEVLLQKQLDRKALLINIGGGMTGDLGGFVAATYKRGIRFVQVPTTSLAMVDASIGGKLGVNFSGVKNSIGVFNNPEAVFIDPLFLESLPKREKIAGLAEVLKHALIYDLALWKELSLSGAKQENIDWDLILVKGIEVKKHFVENDPQEHNIRKALNFGHTIGHAIESWYLTGKQPLLHGEAVALGMVAEAYISYLKKDLSKSSLEDIQHTIKNYFPLTIPDSADKQALLELMYNDKKNEGAINFSLIGPPGSYLLNASATKDEIFDAIDFCFQTFS